MFGGKLRPVKDKLYKLQILRVTENIRHEMTESGNLVGRNQRGRVSGTAVFRLIWFVGLLLLSIALSQGG